MPEPEIADLKLGAPQAAWSLVAPYSRNQMVPMVSY